MGVVPSFSHPVLSSSSSSLNRKDAKVSASGARRDACASLPVYLVTSAFVIVLVLVVVVIIIVVVVVVVLVFLIVRTPSVLVVFFSFFVVSR